MRNQKTRVFRSKYGYLMKAPVPFENGKVFVPDEVLCDPVEYVDSGAEFPGHWLAEERDATYKGVRAANAITKGWLRLCLERDEEDPLHFRLRPRHSTPLVEPRYWEIRVELEGRIATVHVTKCTLSRFKSQVWPAWDKKLNSPGLAVDLQPTKVLRQGEILAWRDGWNEQQFRVSVHEADEGNLPKVLSIEKLRWTQSAIRAWSESDEAIR